MNALCKTPNPSPLAEDIMQDLYWHLESTLNNGAIIIETQYGYRAEIPHSLHGEIYIHEDNLDDLLDEIFEYV
jgi:hypothetical protein